MDIRGHLSRLWDGRVSKCMMRTITHNILGRGEGSCWILAKGLIITGILRLGAVALMLVGKGKLSYDPGILSFIHPSIL